MKYIQCIQCSSGEILRIATVDTVELNQCEVELLLGQTVYTTYESEINQTQEKNGMVKKYDVLGYNEMLIGTVTFHEARESAKVIHQGEYIVLKEDSTHLEYLYQLGVDARGAFKVVQTLPTHFVIEGIGLQVSYDEVERVFTDYLEYSNYINFMIQDF